MSFKWLSRWGGIWVAVVALLGGCAVDQAPLAPEEEAQVAASENSRFLLAFSPEAAQRAAKLTALPPDGRSVAELFDATGGTLEVSEANAPGLGDDLLVRFWVPEGALAEGVDPTSTTSAIADPADGVQITMAVYGNALSELIVDFGPDGLLFDPNSWLSLALGWDLVDMPTEKLVVWHIHDNGMIEQAEAIVYSTDRGLKIHVVVPGFSRYSMGGGGP
jgi:hypothetical protein